MAELEPSARYTPVRQGKISSVPSPIAACRREVASFLSEGHEAEAFGVCVGLAILTAQPVEVLWETFMLI